MGPWAGFFQSSAAAAATLLGLVVVAISINLARILAWPHLPARAAAALAPLAGALAVTLLGLVPGQPAALFGVETLLAGLLMWGFVLMSLRRASGQTGVVPPGRQLANLALGHAQSLPFVAAGLLMIAGGETGAAIGAYCIVPGVILSLLAGLMNTWVLMVEIAR